MPDRTRGKRPHRGFTLIELILAGLIMVVVGGFGLYSLAGGRKSTQSRGMAEEIAEELKAARQQAISKQMPVALAFPTNNGSSRSSQSFYQLEGASGPRVTRSIDYSQTYRDSCMYWGSWAGAVAESTALSASETEFDVATWTPLPRPNDFLLVFTPSGTVKSNGLPLFGGSEYRLLVSNGVRDAGGSPQAVSKPYTVRIGKSGAVSVQPGVFEASLPDDPSLQVSAAPADAPAPSPPSGSPNILRVRSEPKPVEESDGGAYTIVPEEGYITLIAEAEDPSGGPLTVEWRAEGPKGSGRFSSEEPVSMSWDPKYVDQGDIDNPLDDTVSARWVGRMNWTPPEDAEHGEIYELTCTVKNPRGATATRVLGSGASIEVVRPHKVACVNTDIWWERYYIAWLNPEGSNVVSVTVPDLVWEQLTPVWSPNGTKLAFYQGKDNADGVYEARLYVVNDDGTGLSNKFTCWGDFADYNFGPSFAPDGSQVAFSSYEEADSESARVWRCNVFGSANKQRLTTETAPPGTITDHSDVSWNPVYGNWILYTGVRTDQATGNHAGSSIRVCDVSAANSRDLIAESGSDYENTIGESHWSFDGRKVVYTQGQKLYYFNFDPSTGMRSGSPVEITPNIPNFKAYMPRFSPDDLQVAVVNDDYDSSDYGSLYVVESLTNTPPYHRVTGGLGGIWGYNWSADGTEFVYSVMDNENIYTVSAAGGTPKNVTPPGFNIMSTPSWWAP